MKRGYDDYDNMVFWYELWFLGSTLPKLPTISKNASNKNCWELNFLQKTQQVHMSIFPRSRARGVGRLPYFKYYNVLKWESRFTIGVSTAKINASNKNCWKLNFLQKTYRAHMSISPRNGARGIEKLLCFKYYNVPLEGSTLPKSESTFPFQYIIIFETQLMIGIWRENYSQHHQYQYNMKTVFLGTRKCRNVLPSTIIGIIPPSHFAGYTIKSFETPNSTAGGDRYVHPLNFL